MNSLFKLLYFLTIGMHVFGVVEGDPTPGEGDPTPGEGDPTPGEGDPTPASFFDSVPEDWRTQLAGEDEGRLNMLNRYTNMKDFIDSGFEAKLKISKGEISTGLPENATEEQLTAFREANGIPVDGKYELSLEQGLELNEAQTEIMNEVYKVAHEGNVPTDVMSAITSALLIGLNGQVEKLSEQHVLDKQQAEQTMKDNWKGDYTSNMNRINNFINGMPEELQEVFKGAVGSDGKSLLNQPAFMQYIVDMDTRLNPMVTIPGGESDPIGSAKQVVLDGLKRMRDDRSEWFKDKDAQAKHELAIRQLQQSGVPVPSL